MKLKNISKTFSKTPDYNRANDGKFISGSGGFTTIKRLPWKRMLPVILVVSLTGGYLIYRSFAATQPPCNLGSAGGGKYLFMRCRYDNKPVTPDVCTIRWAINPGSLRNKNLPYEAVTKNVVAEISRYMGVPWQYMGQVNYMAQNRPVGQEDVMLVDYSAKLDQTILQYRPGGAEAIVRPGYVFRNGRTVLEGSTVSVYLDFIQKNSSQKGNLASSSGQGGALTSSNFNQRMSGLLGHEISHTVGLADLYKGGNTNGIIDYTQRMGKLTVGWGAGDKAGLRVAGTESRDINKCHVSAAAARVSKAEATKQVEAVYAGLLGRKPEAAGKQYWEKSLMAGRVGANELPEKIAQLSESRKVFAGATATNTKLNKIYQNTLCRLPSAAELSYWTARYKQQGFAVTAQQIALSNEAVSKRRAVPANTRICR